MGRILTKEEWMRRKKLKRQALLLLAAALLLAILILLALIIGNLIIRIFTPAENRIETIDITLSNGTLINKKYLTPNPYSRPQMKLKNVKGIVIHYTANPKTTAEANRNYFESLATTKTTKVSSHFIIGIEGEIIQCIPLTEIAYASNDRNDDTISIECCHEDETGVFSQQTYESLVALTAELCREFDLEEEGILRHYDVNTKPCPLYYVENEEAWNKFKEDVINVVNGTITEKE
ncbi:MAG TPA: peptidoglycan recognition family protein [Mobilitalea sp.]|nr:peptidoglycan recognition family protein [Mobilitalea sp.]